MYCADHDAALHVVRSAHKRALLSELQSDEASSCILLDDSAKKMRELVNKHTAKADATLAAAQTAIRA